MSGKKLVVLAILIAFAAGLILAGCSSKPSSNAGTSAKVIRVGAEAWMVDKLYLKKSADKFMANNPGIEVKIQPYADRQVLSNFALQWSQNKSDVDVVLVDGASTAAQFLAKDLIIDFNKTKFFEGPTAKENFVGKTLEFCAVDGIQFALPIGLETYDINVNKKHFVEAGLVDANGKILEPKNWQEVYEIAKKMTKREGDKVIRHGMTIQWGPNAYSVLNAVEQAARGSFYKADGKTNTFDTPEMREIFQIWRKGVEDGTFSIDTFTNKDAGRNNFNAGQVPMLLQSAAHVAEAAPTVGKENLTLISMPGAKKNGSYGFSAGIIVPKASPNQELALKFIQQGLMSDVQAGAGTQWGKLPVLKNHFNKIDADWKTHIYNLVQISKPNPFYKDLPKISVETTKLLQEYLLGKQDLNTFIANLENVIAKADKNVR
jgi:ABC-type glycerol-3-phosphate transport system substrate-binding protein